MLDRLKAWVRSWLYPQPIEVVRVIEVPTRRIPVLDDETRLALRSLEAHPGFQYLLDILRFQQAAITSKLATSTPDDLREVDRQQALIRALRWLEAQFNHELQRIEAPHRNPMAVEEEMLTRARNAIEMIGQSVN